MTYCTMLTTQSGVFTHLNDPRRSNQTLHAACGVFGHFTEVKQYLYQTTKATQYPTGPLCSVCKSTWEYYLLTERDRYDEILSNFDEHTHQAVT